MSKFYAVAKGRVPGIYTDWISCKKQVDGFSGACYKSFKTLSEAKAFLTPFPFSVPSPSSVRNIPTSTEQKEEKKEEEKKEKKEEEKKEKKEEEKKEEKVIEIYTDGSHFKHEAGGGYSGFGAFTKWGGGEWELSGHCNLEVLRKYGLDSTTVFSNPTCEFLALGEVLSIFCDNAIGNEKYTLVFYIDYIGIEAWVTGKWKTSALHIKKIKEVVDRKIRKLKEMGWDIQFKRVAAHTGVEGNEKADSLAKSKDSINTFVTLASNL